MRFRSVLRLVWVSAALALLLLAFGLGAARAGNALHFVGQPQTTGAGHALSSGGVTVQATDGSSNPLANVGVTVSLSGGPAGAALGGTRTRTTDSGGVAHFSDLNITTVGTGYSLGASGAQATATSNTFSITPGPVATLVYTNAPQTTTAAQPINAGTGVVVRAQDAYSNPVPSVGVSVRLNNGGNGAAMIGTLAQTTDASGNATFPDLSIAKAGTGYSLTASAGSLTSTSPTFSITVGPAATLSFITAPADTAAGQPISGPGGVVVQATDAGGNAVPGIAVSLQASGGGGGSLGGATSVTTDAQGDATFNNVDITLEGAGYRLRASTTAGNAPTATSGTFTISAGAVQFITFASPPTDTTAAQVINSPAGVTVHIQDAYRNDVAGASVTVSLLPNGNAGASLTGTPLQISDINGVATFNDLRVAKAGTGYQLEAAVGGANAVSAAFRISVGPTASIVFSQQPQNTTAGQVINAASGVVVHAQDAGGNPVSGVSVALTLNSSGATLVGTTTQTTGAGGNAVFADLSIAKAGILDTLKATAAGLSATSQFFNILAGPAASLAFSQQPQTTAAGQVINAGSGVIVYAQDAKGNPVGGVSVSLSLNSSGATLGGTTQQTTAGTGVATFANLSVAKAGTGDTLTATANGLSATSQAFNVTPGPTASVAFTSQPSNASVGQTLGSVVIHVQDAQNNPIPNLGVSVGLSSGGGSLSGAAPQTTDANGNATFGGLSVTEPGTGDTLTATAGGLSAVSAAFSVTPAFSWAAVSVSAGGDGDTRLLWDNVSGRAAVWKLDPSGNFVTQQQYGPYAGWTARAISTGRDNNTRVLWTNADGRAAYHLLDANSNYVGQQQYGPYAGWTAQGLAVEPDGTSRALWVNADGTATVWTLDAGNDYKGQQSYGPYAGWAARSLAVSPDGTERLLWVNENGMAAFWRLDSQSQYLDQRQYGPYAGFTAQAIASAPDGTGRAVWVNGDGHIALWNMDAGNNYAGQTQYGPFGGWGFQAISVGADGNSRLLWDNVGGLSDLWDLTPSGQSAAFSQFGPY